MTLACKDANSKFVDVVVVTVADVDDEEHVGNSLVEIFTLKFVQYLVEVMNLKLARHSEARFGQDLKFMFS